MNINWKDFRQMYFIGVLVLLADMIIGIFAGSSIQPMASFVLFLAPGLYYFSKNRHDKNDASAASALFGFTMTPVYYMLLLVGSFFTLADLTGSFQTDWAWLFFNMDWIGLMVSLVLSGIILTIITMISWLIIRILPHKDANAESPKKL